MAHSQYNSHSDGRNYLPGKSCYLYIIVTKMAIIWFNCNLSLNIEKH